MRSLVRIVTLFHLSVIQTGWPPFSPSEAVPLSPAALHSGHSRPCAGPLLQALGCRAWEFGLSVQGSHSSWMYAFGFEAWECQGRIMSMAFQINRGRNGTVITPRTEKGQIREDLKAWVSASPFYTKFMRYIHIYICTCIHIHMYIYICTHACMYVCMYVRMYVCRYVWLCMYVLCMYVHT